MWFWKGLNDVNMKQSIYYNALDNECRTHECIDASRTYEVKVTTKKRCTYCVSVNHTW